MSNVFTSMPFVIGQAKEDYLSPGVTAVVKKANGEQVPIVPGHPANINGSACPSRKKCHANERLATDFAQFIMKKHGEAQQYAYKCPECEYWHLTTRPQNGEHTMAEVNYAEAAKNDPVNHKGETRDKVKLLRERGMNAPEIAAELGKSERDVKYHLSRLDGTYKPRAKKEDAPAVAAPVTHTLTGNIADLDRQMEELSAKMAAMAEEKQRLIEFRSLKVFVNGGGHSLHIQKEGEHMTLPAADIADLIEKLEEIVTAPAQHGVAMQDMQCESH